MEINSIQNSEEAEMLEAEIKTEVSRVREIWVPKIKDVIQLYERREISYEEAKEKIEALKKEYMKK